MKLYGWKDIDEWIFGKTIDLPNTKSVDSEDIPPAAMVLGQAWLGKPSSGKTAALARTQVDHLITHPEESLVSFDGSQSFTDTFLNIVLSKPKPIRDALLKRIIYDEIGNPDWVMTLPEIHGSYKMPMEDQITRAIQNFEALNPHLITETPIMGGIPVTHYGRELFRLLTVIPNEYQTTWQISEAKYLLTDKALLRTALKRFGHSAPSAKWFLENKYLKLKDEETDRKSLALVSVLEDIEAPAIRPRIGYHRPSYTFPDIIENGKILLVNARRVNYHDRTLAYILTQTKSLLMSEIAKREPDDPANPRVTFLLDEVPALIDLVDMQNTLKRMSTYFRTRYLQPVIVAQELSQFPEDLRPHIWGYANIVCFNLLNFDDAFEVAQQLFPYVPKTIKIPSVNPTGQPVMEPDRGQYLQIGNYIRSLKHRECVVRKQISQKESEKYICWVKKTREAVMTATRKDIQEFKNENMEEYGFRVDEVTASINRRTKDFVKGGDAIEPPSLS